MKHSDEEQIWATSPGCGVFTPASLLLLVQGNTSESGL